MTGIFAICTLLAMESMRHGCVGGCTPTRWALIPRGFAGSPGYGQYQGVSEANRAVTSTQTSTSLPTDRPRLSRGLSCLVSSFTIWACLLASAVVSPVVAGGQAPEANMLRYYGPVRRGRVYYALLYDDCTRRRTQRSLHTGRLSVARQIIERMRAEELLRPRGALAQVVLDASEAAERWLGDLRRSSAPGTIRIAERCVRGVLAHVGRSIRLREIESEHIRGCLASAAANLRPSTLNLHRRVLSWWLGWCERQGLVDRNPVRAVAAVREVPRAVRALTPDEESRLLVTVARMGDPVDLFARLGLWTGLRRAALAALRWEWLDLEDGMIHVPAEAQKGGKALRVPMDPRACAVLRERRSAVEGLVFARSAYTLAEMLGRAYARAGISGATVHTLRKTFYSRLLERGARPEVAQRLMGHTGIRVGLTHYLDVRTDELRQAFK